MGFFKGGRKTQLYMRSDAHGERMQKVYALDYCAAGFVTEGLSSTLLFLSPCSPVVWPSDFPSNPISIPICPPMCRRVPLLALIFSASFAGEVKYCIAKLFSGDVKFATALDY